MNHRAWISGLALASALSLLLGACGEEEAVRARGAAVGAPSASDVSAPASSAPRSFLTARPSPEKVALLVGIDRCAPGTPASLAPLSGCKNDTARAKQVLVERFGFDERDVLVLNDEEATHENLVRAFYEWLILRAGPDTEAVFWFSGHGSRVPDLSGSATAEREGLDSTYIAYDSRVGDLDGAYDVSDDELHSLLLALVAKTSRVTVITDACYSGGGVRSATPTLVARAADRGSNAFDPARVKAFWPEEVELLEDGEGPELAPDRYVHIAACSPWQKALEIPTRDAVGNEKIHGALTWFLAQALEEVQPGRAYRHLADRVAVRLANRLPGQTVWHEGGIDREVFGATFDERPTGYLAELDDQGILVRAGSVHGLRPGSELAIVGENGEALGRAELFRVAGLSSLARWIDETPAVIEAASAGGEGGALALRAIETSRPAGQPPLTLFLQDAALAPLVADSDAARVVSRSEADYELCVGPEDELELRAPDGSLVWREPEHPGDDDARGRRLERMLREELRHRALLRLAATPGSVRLQAVFAIATAEECMRARGEPVTVAPHRAPEGSEAAGNEYRCVGGYLPDDRRLAILEVRNPTDEPVFVSVLSVAEDRARNVIWPTGGRRDCVLPPGEVERIPLLVVANENWEADHPMRDRYLVFATSEFADLEGFERASTLRAAGQSFEMPELILEALRGVVTRGSRRVPVRSEGWGVTAVDLLVDLP